MQGVEIWMDVGDKRLRRKRGEQALSISSQVGRNLGTLANANLRTRHSASKDARFLLLITYILQ